MGTRWVTTGEGTQQFWHILLRRNLRRLLRNSLRTPLQYPNSFSGLTTEYLYSAFFFSFPMISSHICFSCFCMIMLIRIWASQEQKPQQKKNLAKILSHLFVNVFFGNEREAFRVSIFSHPGVQNFGTWSVFSHPGCHVSARGKTPKIF